VNKSDCRQVSRRKFIQNEATVALGVTSGLRSVVRASMLGTDPNLTSLSADVAMVSITSREFAGGIQNPLKGFRPGSGEDKPFCSLFRHYITFTLFSVLSRS
jgi:hypothetical protein